MIPTSNLASLLMQAGQRFPERAGIIQGERVWRWGELAGRVRAAAGGLAALGVGRGDRVLVQARNSAAMFETMWASWAIGAVWVPVNFRLTPAEVGDLARRSRPVAHIFEGVFPEHRAACRASNPVCRVEVGIGGEGLEWEDLAGGEAEGFELAAVDRDEVCWFFYTSGTTGRPKAGMLTHGQMAFVVTNHLCDLMPGTTERDVSLVVAPLSHGAGVHAVTQAARGAASVLLGSERLDCGEAWGLVERHRVTNMFTVPTILTMLTRDGAVDRVDHSSLRYVIYAGAPMYRADQEHALGKLGPVLVQYFGLGEVTGNITVLTPEMHLDGGVLGSCGVARTGMEVAVLDAAGGRMGAGETGEICVRGPAVFAGYFEDEEATGKAFAHGWFHTGDLGHLDGRGFLFITGRQSDMYISGGSNVYPREIEELLLTAPGVAEACVVGVPHAKWGESGVAVVVAAAGAVVEEGAVLEWLEGRLARYKRPGRVVVWEDLPKSGYGKVVKAEVRRRLLGEGGFPAGEVLG